MGKSWRVGGFFTTPLKNMSSSIGMISNPIYGKIKNVANHQPNGGWLIFERKVRIPKEKPPLGDLVIRSLRFSAP